MVASDSVTSPVALVVADHGVAMASADGVATYKFPDAFDAIGVAVERGVRFVWWSARETATPLVERGIRPAACWDLAAVHRLLHGRSRDDPAAVWASARDLEEPPRPNAELDLLDLDADGDGSALRPDGQLSREWCAGSWRADLEHAARWARFAYASYELQSIALQRLSDPRAEPGAGGHSLAILTAHSESAAALLAVELGHDGLPFDCEAAVAILQPVIGPRPVDDAMATRHRAMRDEAVRRLFPGGEGVDLRNPAQVRAMLARVGLDLPDTRSWRLEPYAATSDAVAALLAWRKAERLSTTYGWSWLDRNVDDDARLRGTWGAAEGAGRMTASAGLHNMPAELRGAVRADAGHVFVRADLGQVEPRVLAAVSGDREFARATRDDDMYAPVAERLGCDRPTAKVAVLAAMYGQTSGAAGSALRDMDRAYPQAMAFLRAAEQSGRDGVDLRTYGGRLLRLSRAADDQRYPPSAWGRFARNAVVQGAAAELFKAWAATVRAGLDAYGGRIVLCLHDELLVHVDEAHAGEAGEFVTRALDRTARWWAASSGVRFVADVGVGRSWVEAH